MKTKVLLLALALTGCDKLLHRDSDTTTTTTTPTTTTTAVATTTATVTATAITTAAATATATTAESAAPSSGWPSYLPDYPGAKVVKKSADYALLETKDPRDKVVAFYKEKLTAAGFPQGASASLGSSAKDPNASTTITTSKGSVMIILTVTPSSGVTKISISIPA